MARHIKQPTVIPAPGNPPKIIREFFGHVNSEDGAVSIAHMQSPAGWSEPAQTPEFDEYTLVLKGCLQVETRHETIQVRAGEAIHTAAGEWIRYSTPEEATEYVAVCLPAFHPDTVHREV
ncbi:MAG: cupin [Calditrichaeota bacterium]|nr:MAG: cupin [Calditrichota bacterium]